MSNKLRKLMVVLLMVTSGMVFGQNYVGWKIGPNIATLHGQSVHNADFLFGFNTSVSYEYGFRDAISSGFGSNLSIQVDGAITTKGAKADFMRILPHYDKVTRITTYGPDTTVFPGVTQSVIYLSLPVLLKYSFGDERSRFKPNVSFGIYANGMFRLAIDGKTLRSLDGNEANDKRLYKDDFMGIEYGLVGGVGFIQKIGGRRTRWAVTGDVRYDLGLSNMGEYRGKPDIPEEQLSDIKTSTIEISFGVRYQLQ